MKSVNKRHMDIMGENSRERGKRVEKEIDKGEGAVARRAVGWKYAEKGTNKEGRR